MGTYLAERYVSARGESRLADDAARLSANGGTGIRLVLTLYLPENESCLHVFDADSVGLVEQVSHDSGLEFDRVAAVVSVVSELLPGALGGDERVERRSA